MNNALVLSVSESIGGAERSLLELIPFLTFEVSVICPENGSFITALKEKRISTIPLKEFSLKQKGTLFSGMSDFLSYRSLRRQVRNILIEAEPDILICNNLAADYCLGTLPVKLQIPTLSIVRDDPLGSRKAAYLKHRTLIVGISEWIETRLGDAGYSQTAVAVNGIDPDFGKGASSRERARNLLGIGPEKIVIGYACQLIHSKNADTFLACAKRLLDDGHNDWMFVIAGEGLYGKTVYEKNLKKEAERVLKENVVFAGFIENMSEFYPALDLFLTLSRNEPFGRTPLEAALCGVLSLVSDEGGYKETFADFPQLRVDPDDIDAVCSAVEGLIESMPDDNLLTQVQEKACSYSASKMAENVISLIKRYF